MYIPFFDSKNKMENAYDRHEKNMERYIKANATATVVMDELGKLEFKILQSFKHFSDLYERIQDRPDFEDVPIGKINIPRQKLDKIKEVSIAADALLGSAGGIAAGVLGGAAAAGATYVAVATFGTASTGTAIASLSGAAATKAILAAIGGGSIAAGGGGVAAGAMILNGLTFGVGFLVVGIALFFTDKKIAEKAQQAWEEMLRAESNISRICTYLYKLDRHCMDYMRALDEVRHVYDEYLIKLENIVRHKNSWKEFSEDEKTTTEVLVKLVTLLYEMCQIKILSNEKDIHGNKLINSSEIFRNICTAREEAGNEQYEKELRRYRGLDEACITNKIYNLEKKECIEYEKKSALAELCATSSSVYIREYSNEKFPRKKIDAFRKQFYGLLHREIVVYYDSTVFGGGDDGYAFGQGTLYYHDDTQLAIPYGKIQRIVLKDDKCIVDSTTKRIELPLSSVDSDKRYIFVEYLRRIVGFE